jgi:hypothetical protein
MTLNRSKTLLTFSASILLVAAASAPARADVTSIDEV